MSSTDDVPPPRPPRARLAAALRRARRAVLRRRRLLAAVLVGVAALAAVRSVAPAPPATTEVVVAARALPAGATLTDADLATVRLPEHAPPDGVVSSPVGRVLAGPMARGEPVTTTRLVGPGLAEGRPDLVTTPVRLPDGAMAGLLRVGDEIDLVAADPQGAAPAVVASGAVVLALPAPAAADSGDGLPGRLVVVGLRIGDVTAVADASLRHFLSFAWSR
ncbi:SAF domain-containing protein [Nocardioides sp. SYSU D00038]|uniref:SAF domain-containing protein n=1 Tax=Nocardioides sp. SYSU D00038 TaxID=2812554 RepID=UPI0019677B50|nr:SAF domain-containing protein [Nocardioides sp. SYSU D00038]